MQRKFQANENWVSEMTECFITQIKNDWIEKYKINWDIVPSTIFLAWAPWAWKTEFIDTIKDNARFVVIDIDKYRILFEWYEWHNASNYQKLSTQVANKIYKFCMQNNLNVIIDWTFWNINVIEQNIQKCIKQNRDFWVVLIYQDPLISYFYTKLRQLEWKRNVPKEIFIEKFYNSIENALKIKQKHPDIFFIFAYKNVKWIFQTNTNVVDKKSFDKKVAINYNKKALIEDLDYIDDIFKQSSKISNKIINFIKPIFDNFNFIMRRLWLKKKEK